MKYKKAAEAPDDKITKKLQIKLRRFQKIHNRIFQNQFQMGMIKKYLKKYLKKAIYLQKKHRKLFII